MDSILETSDLGSSSPGWDPGEPATPEGDLNRAYLLQGQEGDLNRAYLLQGQEGDLNRAYLLQGQEGDLNRAYFLQDHEDPHPDTPPPIIPETPSPQCLRSRLCFHTSEDIETAAILSPPAGCGTTPPVAQRSKRRRLCGTTRTQANPGASWRTSDFVPASSLIGTWLEPPLPPPPSSSASSSLGAPPTSRPPAMRNEEGLYRDQQDDIRSQVPIAGSTEVVDPARPPPRLTRGRKRASKTAGSTTSSSTSSTSTSSTSTSSTSTSSASTKSSSSKSSTKTTSHHKTTQKKRERSPPAAEERLKYEEIVLSDDEDDDVIVQAMVRSVQMEEDEAFARSLQEQFDREEQQQRRQEVTPPHHHHHHRPPHHHHHPYEASPLGLDWMLPWPGISLAAFSSLAAELAAEPEDDGRARRRGRVQSHTRSSRRRNTPALPDWATMDDAAGNEYEALLAFEEQQGAVAKPTLSERELNSLPTKTYDPAHSAGKTRCQICFSDYDEGEELKMLPCLHDYHVQCIDRWLQQSTTCPICRVDVSETGQGWP